MKHLQDVEAQGVELPKSFITKATGCYYTDERVAHQMASEVIEAWLCRIRPSDSVLRVLDPFGGDGRLVLEFLKEWSKRRLPDVRWEVELWDLNGEGLHTAEEELEKARELCQINLSHALKIGDAFNLSNGLDAGFDIVLSNPPWELVKPDRRELRCFSPEQSTSYIAALRDYDNFLAAAYPLSQPSRKFAGWGTNLSRVGYDLCQSLVVENGVLGIVMPASFMADDLSVSLRRSVLEGSRVHQISYYPAEAKLFASADVAAITIVTEPNRLEEAATSLTRYDLDLQIVSKEDLKIDLDFLKTTGFTVPVAFGKGAISLIQKFSRALPTWGDLEGSEQCSLWAGRELDETAIKARLTDEGSGPLFIKGRMINRFEIIECPSQSVANCNALKTIRNTRIAWRDVSRPSQKRRVMATLIPPGVIAGNSLGVAYFRDCNKFSLKTFLGIISSLVFEFQLRSHLATGHVSLSAMRKVRVPTRSSLESFEDIYAEVNSLLKNPKRSSSRLEALVAYQAYSLNAEEFENVLQAFPKLNETERTEILEHFRKIEFSERSNSCKLAKMPGKRL